MASTIICMPTFGAPYIIGEFKTKKEFTTLSKKIKEEHYGVSLDKFYPSLMIHPMFCDNVFWKQADTLLKSGKAKIYADDEGGNKFCPNMGIILAPQFRGQNAFGELFLVIKDKDLNKVVKKEDLQTEEQYKKHVEGEDEEDDE